MSEDAVSPQPFASRWIEIWVPLAIVLLDQLTKALVRSFVPIGSSVEVIKGLANVTHVRNTGAAFGFLNASELPFKTVAIALIAIGAIVWIGFYAASLPRQQIMARFGLALIMGGAAGNLVDRVVIGSVVDFVDVYWRSYHFWAFNVADSAITVGVTIMILLGLLEMFGARPHVSKTV